MAEQRDVLGGLQRGFVLALLLNFALLAVPLRSYVQPLNIMSAIPFGFIGAVWGHIFLGLDVSMMSMFGIVAVTGVVVNDRLIVVDFINRAPAVHADVGRMAQQAGAAPRTGGVRGGPSRAGRARGGRPPLPADPADLAHHLLRPRAAEAVGSHVAAPYLPMKAGPWASVTRQSEQRSASRELTPVPRSEALSRTSGVARTPTRADVPIS